MSGQARGLGKGLGALIPSGATGTARDDAAAKPAGLLELSVADIIPNPRQPRTRMDPDALSELAASIREHGLIQPLIVTHAPPTSAARFQLIAGERRWRAAQLAGLKTVPAILKDTTSEQFLELALVENIQRADLDPLEEAEAFQSLMADFSMSQQEVADRVGKSRVAIANTIRLLRLPQRVKALLAEGALTEGHARALLALDRDEAQIAAAGQVIARGLNVRQTEDLVRRLSARSDDEAPEPAGEDPNLHQTRKLEEAFRGALGTRVALTRGRKGAGKLVISFFSDEELQDIYERIVGAE